MRASRLALINTECIEEDYEILIFMKNVKKFVDLKSKTKNSTRCIIQTVVCMPRIRT